MFHEFNSDAQKRLKGICEFLDAQNITTMKGAIGILSAEDYDLLWRMVVKNQDLMAKHGLSWL